MYRNTRFGALMKGLSRPAFEKIVAHYQADKHQKGFRCWDQLMAMIYGQLSGCRSLRELETGFNSQPLHHYHLGTRSIKRSTLSDANAKRSSEVFAQVCAELLGQMSRSLRNELKDLLYLIDSTPIPLKGLGFDDWAGANRSDRTQGLKVHLMIEHSQALPVHAQFTPANVNDIEVGRTLPIESGSTYVFDKGYCDYNWWFRIHQGKAFFVSRFKKNAGINVVRSMQPRGEVSADILEDSVVEFKNRHPGGQRINHYYGTELRKVVVNRPDKSTPLVLVTNDFNRTADEIALRYKQRWGIELFFKWLKQNLKIKQFLGRSENAVKIQIYTALITYMLVYLYHHRQALKTTLRMCLVELKTGLFQRPAIEDEMIRKRRQLDKAYSNRQRVLCV